MTKAVIEAIKNRRTVVRFEDKPIEDEKVKALLEAGRWAPSWLNKQPWHFILVKDQTVKDQLREVVPTIFKQGIKDAPVCIAVTIDTEQDPFHFIEDGAAASQNILLAAQSLDLQSCWIGIFDLKGLKDSGETKARKILEIPKKHRLISLLLIGKSSQISKKERKELDHLVYRDKFGKH